MMVSPGGLPSIVLGVDSESILFNHRSFQKPAVSPGVLMFFWKEVSLERMGKCPLENSGRWKHWVLELASL